MGTYIKTEKSIYRVVEEIGQGGNGCVWRVEEEETKNNYIIKILLSIRKCF